MTFGIAAIATGVLGAGAAIYGANKAAGAQKAGIEASTAAQQKMFDEQKALNAPFREGGLTAQNRLLTVLGLTPTAGSGITVDPNSPDFGKYAGDFGMKDFEADPGYAFRLKEGMKGLQNSAAARGLLSSGSTLKGITDYGQNMASQEYGNAYNRYQTNRANQLNPLTGLINSGQGAVNNLTNAAGTMGQNLGQAAAATGAANAGSYINTGNALTNALSSGMNSYMNYNMLGNMRQSAYPTNVGSATGYVK
jgi:hypothetical protein